MDYGDTLKISEPATSLTIIILNSNLYQFKKINILAKTASLRTNTLENGSEISTAKARG